MILPNPKDALHRGQLYKILIEVADNKVLAKSLIFKGGTCASLQGYLDRFSVDLDFDLVPGVSKIKVQKQLKGIFTGLGFSIKNQNINTIQYVLKYPARENQRNTLKIDAIDYYLPENTCQPTFIADIDRFLICQTIETMFAHKLVAVIDRFERHQAIAGRDIYDIYYFFSNEYKYNEKIINSRTGLSLKQYLTKLVDFIEKHVDQTVINEDLNMLLPPQKFSAIRKSLKAEVLTILKSEIEAIGLP